MPSEEEWAADRSAFLRRADADEAEARGQAVELSTEDIGAHTLGPLAQQFAVLTNALLATTTVAGVLQEVVLTARTVLPHADLVSVTLRNGDGEFFTPVHTEPLALDLDKLQYEYGEGPCVEAARRSGPGYAVSDDLAVDPRWTRFGPAAARLGMCAVLATSLLPNAEPPEMSGALNVYSRRTGGFDEADRTLALLLATHASLALAHVEAVTFAELQATNMRKAIDSRDVIGQAKGILMGRRGITSGDAFDLLRRTSQDLNIKLVDLAQTLADRHTELDLPTTDGYRVVQREDAD